jgi:hypothetical protein
MFLITKTNGWFAVNCLGGAGEHFNIMTAPGKEGKKDSLNATDLNGIQ